jgi:Repeat of unknown function (DUF5907)
MNTINKAIVLTVIMAAPVVVKAQILSNGLIVNQFSTENVFLDLSTNFDPLVTSSNIIGKGLLFPRTDLTKWIFNVESLDGILFPTAFDGMIVYNTGTGSTPVTGNNPSISTNVTPGFYYFSNPSGSTTVSGGMWKAVGADASTTAKGVVQLSGDLTGTAASPSIASSAITSAKIADGTITAADLSSMSATSGQVLKWNGTAWAPAADDNTGNAYAGSTSVGLNGSSFERAALTGDVTAPANSNATTISANAVTSAKIADGTIATADIGDSQITSAKILDATVSNADLAIGAGGIYKGSGSLSSNTTISQDTNSLNFTSSATTGTSHFTVDGSTLNVDAVNNRIGIGTAVPHSQLHLGNSTGNRKMILFEDGNNDNQYYGLGINLYMMRYQVSNPSSRHAFYAANDASSSRELMTINGNGKVGIGISAPNSTLDVIASSTDGSRAEGFIAPRLTGDQIKSGDAQYGANQTGTILYATAAVTASSTKTANITSAGYYYFDGSLWQKIGTGVGTVSSVTGVAPISVSTGTSTPAISIATANSTTTGALSSTDWSTFNSKLGNVLTSGNLFVGNASNLATAVPMSGDATISNTGVVSIGTGKVTSAHILDGTIGAADLNNMSATSGQVLKYNGTAWAPAADNNSGTAYTASNGLSLSGSNFTLGGALTGPTSISGLSDTNTLNFISPNDANAVITIGTPAGTSGGVYLGNPWVGVRRGFAAAGAGNDVGLYTTAGKVYLSSNNESTGEFVLTGGKVGIGTTAPHAYLHLGPNLGNRKFILLEEADNDNSFYGMGVNPGILRYQVGNTGARHAFFAGVDAASSKELMTINGDGKVGIGTSTPQKILHVDGDVVMNITGPSQIANMNATNTFSFISTTGDGAAVNIGTSAGGSGGVYFGNAAHGVKRGFPTLGQDNNVGLYTTSGHLFLSTNGSSIGEFILTDDGKVGIGTLGPSSKLEVGGAATNTSAHNADQTTNNSIIDFSLSNLAYTSSTSATITLNNMKNGGAYTLIFTSTSATGSVTFNASGFSMVQMGTSARTNGKKHIYSFIVVGTEVYVTMATQN